MDKNIYLLSFMNCDIMCALTTRELFMSMLSGYGSNELSALVVSRMVAYT